MSLLVRRLSAASSVRNSCKRLTAALNNTAYGLQTSSQCLAFFERDTKGRYKRDNPEPFYHNLFNRESWDLLKNEVKLWKQEVIEKFRDDPILFHTPGVVDKVWEFNRGEVLSNWVVTSDSDHEEGFSTSQLTVNAQGKGLFSGTLSTRIPKDGKIKRAGYCNMRTLRVTKSFQRESYLDWSTYSHLVLRVRGDGRSYLINLHTAGYFDVTWHDIYNFFLYTRGGPYWQVAKIPFSKFFFTSKGRVQDKQESIPLHMISHFGITVGDRINGDFNLEIDYIGLEFDPVHKETFAYEMYKAPARHIVGV